MKRVGYLFEQVISFENLISAARKATRGKKTKSDVADFLFHLETNICDLQQELATSSYRPEPYKMFTVYEPKERLICCSHIRDRVVHHALCSVLEPWIEKRLISDSYACRRGKGTHRAIDRVQQYSRSHGYFIKADISKYFASIDHERLKNLLRRMFKDLRVLKLLDDIIDHAVPGHIDGKGLPIGNLTSQHFANLYLGELDLFVKNQLCVKGYVRYMDDFIVFAPTKEKASEYLRAIEWFVGEHLDLTLNQRVQVLAPVSRGVPFLGFNIYPHLVRIKRQNLVRLRRKVRRNGRMLKSRQVKFDFFQDLAIAGSTASALAHVSVANSLLLRRKESLNW